MADMGVASPFFSSIDNWSFPVVISDFPEDEDQFNFAEDRQFKPIAKSRAFARSPTKHSQRCHRVSAVHLETFRSRDRQAVSIERLAAIDAFWKAFLIEN